MRIVQKLRSHTVVAILTASLASGPGLAAGDDSDAKNRRQRAERARIAAAEKTAPPTSALNPDPSALTVTRNATDMALAVSQSASPLTGSTYPAIPPSGDPEAVDDVAVGGFPTHGTTFGILTTGDAKIFHTADSSDSSGTNDGGGNVRGNTDFDVTILKIDLNVPAGANCLSITFRFYSEEFPEYVGSDFNDAFIAELDTSNWTTSGSTITAPNNFARDPSGNVISINAAGVTSMTEANAAGTTYDGATPLLGASTPITPGAHSLYLSIFDQSDAIYDSAVAIDSLVLGTTGPGGCVAGATPLSVAKTTDRPNTHPSSTDGYTVTVRNPNATSLSVDSITDSLPAGYAYVMGSTTGITTSNPAVSGQNLTWSGPFVIPGAGSSSLRFNVTTAATTGVYFNNASAVGTGGSSVVPSGPAAINVLNGVALHRTRDFDFDGKSDVTVYHGATGHWYARRSSDSMTFNVQYGGMGYTPVPGDYDRDGKTDVAAYHEQSGLWFIRQSSNSQTITMGFGGNGYKPVAGDYDGDGKTDHAVFHQASGLWFVYQSSTGTSFSFPFGGPGATPVVGDFDGDGRTDIVVYYEAEGLWYVRQSTTGTSYSFGFGGTNYKPLSADFDGDGRTDIAVWHQPTSLWFVRQSSSGTNVVTAFGGSTALPVPKDMDGDGLSDYVVYYRDTGGVWYVKNSTTGLTTNVGYGGTGFDPIY